MIVFALVIQDVVAISLLAAGVAKTGSYRTFRSAVSDYQLVPERFISVITRAVPIAEVLIGGLLVSAMARPAGVVGAASALMLFALAMAVNLARGRRIDCGCASGRHARPISWWLVLRNVSLVVILVFSGVLTAGSSQSFLDARLPALVAAVGLVMATSAGRAAAALWRHSALSAQPVGVLP